MPGTSDIVIVKHKSGQYKSTPFLACFGPYAVLSKTKTVNISINGILISNAKFTLDKHGYSQPMYPSGQDIKKMGLKFGKN
jgi:phosphatidate phosphatase PAH1